ncbi:unnamed protein product [Mytilus coruscus]|uniref:C-type lectin domain-containing protein n=1 Tax=Mytilus coruscus TaxID=42192 RepID=A0A6J8DK66_MYTCO|nr:unnamed protein product [Mytilus coruscus]
MNIQTPINNVIEHIHSYHFIIAKSEEIQKRRLPCVITTATQRHGSKKKTVGKLKEPQLCIGVWNNGLMYDYYCYNKNGLICQKDLDGSGICESGWEIFGAQCYRRLRKHGSGATFKDAKTLCSTENAYIMMPQSQNDAGSIATTLDCGSHCWIGITDFDADHIYTWEDGAEENQSNLYFGDGEPNNRNQHYMCAYVQNGQFYNGECTETRRVICEIDAIDNMTTTASIQISTKTESTSADLQTTVHTFATTTNPTSMTESEKTTIKLMTFPVTIMSVFGMACIDKCTSYCSEYINGSVDARPNILYRVDRKSLSSYRRSHQSAPDSRMSSLYIGCVGCAILIMTILFIIMLDFLPSA